MLVTRTVKDGQLRMVFWNEIKPIEGSGGVQVEKGAFPSIVALYMHHLFEFQLSVLQHVLNLSQFLEFLDLWHSLKVPTEPDLLRQLASEGLQVTAAEAVVPKTGTGKKKGKKGGAPRQRQVRITNTHLKGEIDLQRDYANHANGK